MKIFSPDNHHRRSVRLPDYDYSQEGAYFVTICTYQRKCLLGEIENGEMHLNAFGKIIQEEWLCSTEIRKEIQLDEFVVMPNHLHGIVVITGDEGAHSVAPLVGAHGRVPLQARLFRPPRSLGAFVAGFKSAAAKRINQIRRMPGAPIWQRSFYEHVIRNLKSLYRIRQYTTENPHNWLLDDDNPINIRPRDVGAHGGAPLKHQRSLNA